ncbi:MAG: hypothetical protein WC451_03430 [Patescibacteria group bacterium]
MEPIKVFDIIAKRRILIFGLICILVSGTMLGFGFNFYQSAKKARAVVSNHTMTNGEVIKQNDTTYDSTDAQVYNIIVPAGVTATIDGEHSFGNLTVNGTLTSTDYNTYGVYNPGNPGDDLFENLIGSDNGEYTFITRGLINVGANPATWIFSACNGQPSNTTTFTQPSDMEVDDMASIEFFDPVAPSDFDFSENYWTGTAKGHSYSSTDGVLVPADGYFVDNFTDATKMLLPFELRYRNAGDNGKFGICYASSDPTNPTANYYLKTVKTVTSDPAQDQTDIFNPTAATPELQTITAWQGASASTYSDSKNNYTQFTSYITGFKSGNDYDASLFYKANFYDLKYDKKLAVRPDLNILTAGRILDDQSSIQNYYDWYRRAKSTLTTNVSSFYPLDGWYSPLASRYFRSFDDNSDRVMQHYQPYLSASLISNLPVKIPTVLNITGTFKVENGGMVNLNGKGFAMTTFSTGSGPGGVTGYGGGGSHSGAGGVGKSNPLYPTRNTPAIAYDTNINHEPALPGSGSIGWHSTIYPWGGGSYSSQSHEWQYDHGNGGGYLDVSAKTIQLETGSIVMANAIGCDTDWSSPAGASGGSIILSDYDSNSYYRGLITAQGASTSEDGSGQTSNPGGGGGYVYVSTATNIYTLENLQDTAQHVEQYPSRVRPARVQAGTWDDYWHVMYSASSSSPVNVVSVIGGNSENGNTGSPGIFSVHGVSMPKLTIQKILNPVSRTTPSVSSDFNPYGLLTTDKVKFDIKVTGLSTGDKIRDVAPVTQFSGQKYLCGDIADINPNYGTTGNDIETGSRYVEWIYSGTDTTVTFSYTCSVRKN